MSEENIKFESSSFEHNQTSSPKHTSSAEDSGYHFWAQQVIEHNTKFKAEDSIPSSNIDDTISNFSTQESMSHSNRNDSMPNSSQDSKRPNKHRFFRKVTAVISSAALFGFIAAGSFLGFNEVYYRINPEARPTNFSLTTNLITSTSSSQNLNQQTQIAATTTSNNTSIKTMDVSDIVTNVMPSMVAITSTFVENYSFWGQQYEQENDGGGSGIIIEQNDSELLIATNNHVVSSAKTITVTFVDGTTAEAVIKGVDSSADLAVISVAYSSLSKETKAAIDVAKLGKSDDVKVGQMVIAIGNALGYGQTVTVGYVSAKDREITTSDINTKLVVLQVDAAINPGNSGGALLNVNGEVIGINSAKISDSSIEGIGYSIPITRALPIVNDLKTKEVLAEDEKGYLGIIFKNVTNEYANELNWPVGIYITQLTPNSSASNAGLLVGDIITAVNDSTITSGEQLREKVTSYRVGTTIKITYQRLIEGVFKEFSTDVTLMQKPTALPSSEEVPSSEAPSANEDNSEDNSSKERIPEEDSNIVNPFDVFEDFFNQLP